MKAKRLNLFFRSCFDQEIIFRGTDSVALLLEWILAKVILHPDIQAKAWSVIDTALVSARPVKDSDLPKLRYLRAIVKGNPKDARQVRSCPGPGSPSMTPTSGGHFIPAGTTAMVNMWAITHDEAVWANPEEFKPERFLEEDGGSDFPIMGSDLRLAPFGSARRVCPGHGGALACPAAAELQMGRFGLQGGLVRVPESVNGDERALGL
ncbi:hypothetical protein ACJRO7_009815 [Eucalyptus globulus]|uniref:Cytochrome P450 n=1 Tax=Eucalyptus globulus TaxID=34317 RepID=A0ABD3L9Z6_EUCGL